MSPLLKYAGAIAAAISLSSGFAGFEAAKTAGLLWIKRERMSACPSEANLPALADGVRSLASWSIAGLRTAPHKFAPIKAFQAYRAAESGDPTSMLKIAGAELALGRDAQAVRWLENARLRGDPVAAPALLAMMAAAGIGMAPNPDLAALRAKEALLAAAAQAKGGAELPEAAKTVGATLAGILLLPSAHRDCLTGNGALQMLGASPAAEAIRNAAYPEK